MKTLLIDYLALHTAAPYILGVWPDIQKDSDREKALTVLRGALQKKPASFMKMQFVILDMTSYSFSPALTRSVYVAVVGLLEILQLYYTTTD